MSQICPSRSIDLSVSIKIYIDDHRIRQSTADMRIYFHSSKSVNDELDSKLLSDVKSRPVVFSIIQYDELHYAVHEFHSLSELNWYLSSTSCTSEDHCTWINIDGIHRSDILDELAIRFNLHSLTKEDICTNNERMKLDLLENGSCIYLLLKLIYIHRDAHTDTDEIHKEQISILLKKNNLLITFQEAKDSTNSFDVFQVVKYRLQNNRGRVRSLKIDYLFYCLLDVIVEHYMSVLDHISVTIDVNERLLMKKFKADHDGERSSSSSNVEQMQSLFHLKHDMLSFRVLCKPLREIIIKLQKAQDRISIADRAVHSRRQYRRKRRPRHIALSGNYFVNPHSDTLTRRWSLGTIEQSAPLFNEYIFMYFKDLNDHIIQLHDRIDTYCDLTCSLITFYIILNDAEMNKIMSILAFVSATFIPLTFIMGLFSMNYENMPPLVWDYGYFLVLAVLGTCAMLMISFFKWKRWL